MAIPLRALIIEDSQNDCDLLLGMLCRGGYDVAHKRVCNAATLGTLLEDEQWDIVISDYSMPGFKGTDALAMVREKGSDVPFVFLSGTIGEEIAVNAHEGRSPRLRDKGQCRTYSVANRWITLITFRRASK